MIWDDILYHAEETIIRREAEKIQNVESLKRWAEDLNISSHPVIRRIVKERSPGQRHAKPKETFTCVTCHKIFKTLYQAKTKPILVRRAARSSTTTPTRRSTKITRDQEGTNEDKTQTKL